MRDHVSDGEIIAKEQINEADDGDKNQPANRHARVARAFDQKGMARANRENTADNRIDRTNKREQQRK